MLNLILRQLAKHWKGLLPVCVIWIICGYYILDYKHDLLTTLSHWFINLPEPGTQNQARAYEYVKTARERIKKGRTGFFCRTFDTEGCKEERILEGNIRLDLMRKACRHISGKYKGDDAYRTHWLEKLEEWNLINKTDSSRQSIDSDNTIVPEHYWKTNKDNVMESLKDLIDAMNYAYEISPSARGEIRGKTWIIPELITKYSEALCMDIPGILAWGDYIEFQEIRAFRSIKKEKPDFEKEYIYPAEQEMRILQKLKYNPKYILALKKYSAGSPPSRGNLENCKRGPYRLSCLSQPEAIKIINKLLYISPEHELPGYRLNLGLIYLMRVNAGERNFLEKSLDNLYEASSNHGTEREARIIMTGIFLRKKDFKQAYDQIKQLQLIPPRNKEYRKLVRLTLIGLGRFTDADCFSDMSKLEFGKRAHCRKLEL